MQLNYRATESFYDGVQRTNLFAEKTLRVTALVFLMFAVAVIPVKVLVPPGFKSESISMIPWLLIVFPLSTYFFGGISRKAWMLYAGFSVFYLAGMIPTSWGMHACLLFTIPSYFFLILLFRAEPKILRGYGYSGMRFAPIEIFGTVVTTALCVSIIYMAAIMLQKTTYAFRPPLTYIVQFLMIVPKYALVWGILYGILMKRMLHLKYEALVPIAFNIFFTAVLFLTEPYDVADPGLIIAKIAAWSTVLNLILGMTYYFTRSARPILIAHALTCVIFVSSSL